MDHIIISLLVIFLVIFLLAIITSGIFIFIALIDSIVLGHSLPTSKRAARSIIKVISENKDAKNFYDLGCAKGELACYIKKNLPAISIYAIDNNPVRIFLAQVKALTSRCKINFLRENIFNINLGNADIVYTYLWYDIMPPLEKKLQKELKKGAIVITNTSNFPNWKPISKVVTCPKVYRKMPDFETLFIYQKS